MNATLPTESAFRSRGIEQRVVGRPARDGAGVRLTRLLGGALQLRLDPFLMLDRFASDQSDDYIAGFPEHPHRGFETVTVMIHGRMRHRDNAGGEGLLEAGGVQWMTAGRGIVHSEMPEQQEGRMEGFQFWINLPAADKLCPAAYRDIPAAALPSLNLPGGVIARIIAGASHGVEGAVRRLHTEPLLLDISLPDGAVFDQKLTPDLNAFVVPYRGAVLVGDDDAPLPVETLAVLDNRPGSDGVRLRAMGSGEDARLILAAGRPLGEPIAQYGPFVMNSEAEIVQALDDFRAGRFGGRVVEG